MSKITQSYYISTGKKNAMYTLRQRRDVEGQLSAVAILMPDFYLCNLAATEELAIAKASAYVEAMRERIGENENFVIEFFPEVDHENFKRRGKLSVRDTHSLEQLEAGIFPFGKHAGKLVADAPDSYILFFADKSKDTTLGVVMQAVAAVCMGVALEKGLIAKRDQVRAERHAVDSQSQFIGKVGERRDFEGEVIVSFYKQTEYGDYWVNKVRCGADIVTYAGCKSLGDVGTVAKFRATIKAHDVYHGINSTKVNRPA